MRYLAGVIGLASVIAVSAATAGFSSQEAAVETTRAAFRKAKPDEIKSTETYCKAALATSSFPERNKFMRQAIQLTAGDEPSRRMLFEAGQFTRTIRCERRGRDLQTEVTIESKYRDHRDRGPM